MVPPSYEPQLAVADAPTLPVVGWRPSRCWTAGGFRWRVSPSTDAAVRITTRSGRPISARVTGLDGLVGAGYEVVVDAELVAGDGSAPSFYGVAPALPRWGLALLARVRPRHGRRAPGRRARHAGAALRQRLTAPEAGSSDLERPGLR